MNDPAFEVNGLKIDPKIFTYKFSCKCNGECCFYGVYTDLNEAKKVISIKDKIISLMDETQPKEISKWFEPPEKDEDFESGVAVGTEINNGKCTFLDKKGLCTLQKFAMNEGEYKWKYKPEYCILFPLTVWEGALTIDDEHRDRLKTCNKNPMPETSIFDACRDELKHFLGEENFKKVEEYGKQYLSSLKAKEVA
jgi:Fe-S-cluster containining protein